MPNDYPYQLVPSHTPRPRPATPLETLPVERLESWGTLDRLGDTPMVQMLSEMSGVAPSQRLVQGLSELQSPVLRPQTPFGWADRIAGLLTSTAETALSAVDLAGGLGAVERAGGRTIEEMLNRLLKSQEGVIDVGFRNLTRPSVLPQRTPRAVSAHETAGEGGVRRFDYTNSDGDFVGEARLMGGTIGDIEVDSAFRRQGYGTAIIEHLKAQGGKSGYPINDASRGLFQKTGIADMRSGMPWAGPLYRGSPTGSSRGVSYTISKEYAKAYGDKIVETRLKPGARVKVLAEYDEDLAGWTSNREFMEKYGDTLRADPDYMLLSEADQAGLKKEGYDAIAMADEGELEIRVLNKNALERPTASERYVHYSRPGAAGIRATHGTFGPDTVYTAKVGAEDEQIWRLGRSEGTEVAISPGARIFKINKEGDYDALAQKVGQENWGELEAILNGLDVKKAASKKQELIDAGIDVIDARVDDGVQNMPQVAIINPTVITNQAREATFTPVDRLPELRQEIVGGKAFKNFYGGDPDYIPPGDRQGARKFPLTDSQGQLMPDQRSSAALKAHPQFTAAKSGSTPAASELVHDLVRPQNVQYAADTFGPDVIYQPIHAIEDAGKNKIPAVLADYYALATGARVGGDIIQAAKVSHTDAKMMDRLLTRPLFDGPVQPGQRYVLIDDTTTSGGTLSEAANYIENQGGIVEGTISLANASRRATIASDPHLASKLREKFGDEIENLFGLRPEALTNREAEYLDRFQSVDALRKTAAARRSKIFADRIAPVEYLKNVRQTARIYADNPAHREITAQYNSGQIDLAGAESLYMQHLNRDRHGQSLAERVFKRELGLRGQRFTDPKWAPYREKIDNVTSTSVSGNKKVVGEYKVGDTSVGCVGFCPECYAAYGGAQQSNTCFGLIRPRQLTGDVGAAPKGMFRFGEAGDPGADPRRFAEIEEHYRQLVSRGNATPAEMDAIIDHVYDWAWTNEQIANVGLARPGQMRGDHYVPGGRDKTWFITKLQSLKNFDPDITRNLEVSVDPQMPSHFFKSLKNVERLAAEHPDVNVMLRIRSMATYSDEINSLQKIAVDFANKQGLDVLETRMRFKGPEGAALAQLLPEYYSHGNQWKHISYYPSVDAFQGPPTYPLGKQKKAGQPRPINVRTFYVHTPDGPADTSTYMVSKLDTRGRVASKKKRSGRSGAGGRK